MPVLLVVLAIVCIIGVVCYRLGQQRPVEQPPSITAAADSASNYISHVPDEPGLTWVEKYQPHRKCRIEYADRHGEFSDRVVFAVGLCKSVDGHSYLGAYDGRAFKTFRTDRILKIADADGVVQAVPHHLELLPLSYPLPPWPGTETILKVPSISGNRHWTVDLSQYTCTCPEKQTRTIQFQPRTLGRVCPHMARAMRDHLPANSGWDERLVSHIYSDTATNMAGMSLSLGVDQLAH